MDASKVTRGCSTKGSDVISSSRSSAFPERGSSTTLRQLAAGMISTPCTMILSCTLHTSRCVFQNTSPTRISCAASLTSVCGHLPTHNTFLGCTASRVRYLPSSLWTPLDAHTCASSLSIDILLLVIVGTHASSIALSDACSRYRSSHSTSL